MNKRTVILRELAMSAGGRVPLTPSTVARLCDKLGYMNTKSLLALIRRMVKAGEISVDRFNTGRMLVLRPGNARTTLLAEPRTALAHKLSPTSSDQQLRDCIKEALCEIASLREHLEHSDAEIRLCHLELSKLRSEAVNTLIAQMGEWHTEEADSHKYDLRSSSILLD